MDSTENIIEIEVIVIINSNKVEVLHRVPQIEEESSIVENVSNVKENVNLLLDGNRDVDVVNQICIYSTNQDFEIAQNVVLHYQKNFIQVLEVSCHFEVAVNAYDDKIIPVDIGIYVVERVMNVV